MTQLDGRTALVTGGTSGIGLAIAKKLAAEGARVVLTGRRDQAAIDAVAKEVGDDAIGVRSDISDPADVTALMQRLDADGVRLDALVASAGGGGFASLAETTLEHYSDTFDRNVRGTLLTVQQALPLLNDGAAVVLLSSDSTFHGTPNFGAYAASKAAIRSFGRTWAAELADRRIRVNTLTPGPTETPGLNGLAADGDVAQLHAALTAGVPMKRLADPDEIAAAALFLASDASSFMTGSELVVDGGHTQV